MKRIKAIMEVLIYKYEKVMAHEGTENNFNLKPQM
jgi:hypothetical protein